MKDMKWYDYLLIVFISFAVMAIIAGKLREFQMEFLWDSVSVIERHYEKKGTPPSAGRIILPEEDEKSQAKEVPESVSNDQILLDEYRRLITYIEKDMPESRYGNPEFSVPRIERRIKKLSGIDYSYQYDSSYSRRGFSLKTQDGKDLTCFLMEDPIAIEVSGTYQKTSEGGIFDKYSPFCFNSLPKLNAALRDLEGAHKQMSTRCAQDEAFCEKDSFNWAREVMSRKNYTETISSMPIWVSIGSFLLIFFSCFGALIIIKVRDCNEWFNG